MDHQREIKLTCRDQLSVISWQAGVSKLLHPTPLAAHPIIHEINLSTHLTKPNRATIVLTTEGHMLTGLHDGSFQLQCRTLGW